MTGQLDEVVVVVLAAVDRLARGRQNAAGSRDHIRLRPAVERHQAQADGPAELRRDEVGIAEQDASRPGGMALRELGRDLRVVAVADVREQVNAVVDIQRTGVACIEPERRLIGEEGRIEVGGHDHAVRSLR